MNEPKKYNAPTSSHFHVINLLPQIYTALAKHSLSLTTPETVKNVLFPFFQPLICEI